VSVLRNLLITCLLVCIAYNGYLIFRNHAAPDPTVTAETDELFSADAFRQLARNSGSAVVKSEPTVVLKAEAETPSSPAENPARAASEAADKDEVVATGGEEFDDYWAEAAEKQSQFQLAEALRILSPHVTDDRLTTEQRQRLETKLQELAATVIFAPNKHLAEPALTASPTTSLDALAEDYKITLPLLREINGLSEEGGPSPGDSIKVLSGPLRATVDLDRQAIWLFVGPLFARKLTIERDTLETLPTSQESLPLDLEGLSADGALRVGEITILADATDPVDTETIELAEKDLTRLREFTSKSTGIRFLPRTPKPEPIAEAMLAGVQTTIADAEQPKTDPAIPTLAALRLEVFSPTEPIPAKSTAEYGLRLTNLSDQKTEPVEIVINFSEGVEPVKVDGAPGQVRVGQAVYDELTLEPAESIQLTFTVEANAAGEHVIRPEVHCLSPKTRIATEVALQVSPLDSSSESTDTAQAAPPVPEKELR